MAVAKKALYLCCIADPWIEVSRRLYKEIDLKPVYFVHWKSDEAQFSDQLKDQCHLQTLEDAWKGLGFPEKCGVASLDEGVQKKISWYELNALKMMDRLDPLGNDFGFQERRYFFQDLLGRWLSIIDVYHLDVVISPSVPHRVFDYALYVACKLKDVRFLMFQMTPFGSNSVLIEDIDSMNTVYPVDNALDRGLSVPSRNIVERIERVKKGYRLAIPDYMVAHEAKRSVSFRSLATAFAKPILRLVLWGFWRVKPNTYWVERGKLPSSTSYTWVSFYITWLRRYMKLRHLEREYAELVSSQLPEKFVLVALHYQPEETTCPTGGSYADQLRLLRVLDAALPEGVSIVVKEHKSQFDLHQEGSSGRDYSFYQRLSQVSKRIAFASVDESPFKLIDSAIATVTISGTIGWESAIRGTPAMTFGRAWYEGMPRVYKLKNKDDVGLYWGSIVSDKGVDFSSAILDFHYQLEERLIKAIHYKAVVKNDDVTIFESIENLSRALIEHLSD